MADAGNTPCETRRSKLPVETATQGGAQAQVETGLDGGVPNTAKLRLTFCNVTVSSSFTSWKMVRRPGQCIYARNKGGNSLVQSEACWKA
jgi:hypothetical protein